MSKKPRFIYLASPYTHDDPRVMQRRHDAVFAAVRRLRTPDMIIFSPIVASHPYTLVDGPGKWETWAVEDRHALLSRDALWIYTLPGWYESKGINAEKLIAHEAKMTVCHVAPTFNEMKILRGDSQADNASDYKWRRANAKCVNPSQGGIPISEVCPYPAEQEPVCGLYETQDETSLDQPDNLTRYPSVALRTCATCHWWFSRGQSSQERHLCVLHNGMNARPKVEVRKLAFGGGQLRTTEEFGCSCWEMDTREAAAKQEQPDNPEGKS